MKIRYFAWLRERLGRGEEEVDLPVSTVAELAVALESRHPELAGRLGPVRFARNAAFATAADAVAAGDEIALIPPVAGG